jgi:hypothetical protein
MGTESGLSGMALLVKRDAGFGFHLNFSNANQLGD